MQAGSTELETYVTVGLPVDSAELVKVEWEAAEVIWIMDDIFACLAVCFCPAFGQTPGVVLTYEVRLIK